MRDNRPQVLSPNNRIVIDRKSQSTKRGQFNSSVPVKSINAICGVQGVAASKTLTLNNRAQNRALIAATYNHRNEVNSRHVMTAAMGPELTPGMI